MKKRLLWATAILAGLLCIAFCFPDVYWRVTGVCCGEAFYEGRPTSYWGAQIRAQEVKNGRLVAKSSLLRRAKEWIGYKNSELIDEKTDAMCKDPVALPVWRQLLRHEEQAVRELAFLLVFYHSVDNGIDTNDLEPLINVLLISNIKTARSDVDPLSRAVDIGEVFGKAADPIFLKHIHDEEPSARRVAMWGLFPRTWEKDPEAIAIMVQFASDPDGIVRGDAVHKLGDLGAVASHALPRLNEIADTDPDRDVRDKAKFAITSIRKNSKE